MKYSAVVFVVLIAVTGCSTEQSRLDDQVDLKAREIAVQAQQREELQRESDKRAKDLTEKGIGTGPTEGRRPFIGPRFGSGY